MKSRILYLLVIIIAICSFNGFAQKADTIHSVTADTIRFADDDPEVENSISIDGVLLIFGAVTPGYERLMYDRISLYGIVGFGNMWFTKINSMYEFGGRYWLTKKMNKGFFGNIGYYRTVIELKSKSAEAGGLTIGAGYRLDMFSQVFLDLNGGIYFSGDDEVTFEEKSGSLTKTISVGGPVKLGFGARVGVDF